MDKAEGNGVRASGELVRRLRAAEHAERVVLAIALPALLASLLPFLAEMAGWLAHGVSPSRAALLAQGLAAILVGTLLVLLRPAFRRNRALIRELEATQHELRAAERRYRSIFENAVEGIFQTSPDGRYLTANTALARMYGYATPEDLMEGVTDITRQIYVEDHRREDFARALAESGEVRDFESRVRRRDGTVIWISENARAAYGMDGELTHYEGAVVDVTERKRAEDELRRHRAHLEERVEERTLRLSQMNDRLEREIAERRRAEADLRLRDRAIAGVSEGIVISDPRLPGNPVVYVNSGFERLTGYAASEILGRSCAFLQGPGTDPAAIARIRAAVAEERECTVEILNYRKDGAAFWNLLSITPVRDEEDRLVSFIGVQFDLTERKRIEQIKDDLVTTVSHELRTPLSSLRGFTELMLQRDYPPERRREFLTIIHGEALRLGRLIDDFLDLQRMEAGRQSYALREIDLGGLARETVRLFALHSDRHWIRLEIEPGLPAVRGDSDRLRQVLSNLLSNAVKFSPDGGEIGVRLRREADGVIVEIADQGIGIEEEALGDLFRKFRRLSAAEERGIGGTGLGLALVRQIVEGQGGRVGVRSRVGVGSTFSFVLPAASTVAVASGGVGAPFALAALAG